MAKFYNGSGVSAVLTNIITHASQNIWIVSPYLKIPIQTKNYLKSADNKEIPITIVYRSDSTLNTEDLQYFKTLKNLNLRFCDNLHSKCYINENEGLVTSMNLHEHSQVSNWEMGIQFTKQGDPEIYTEVTRELNFLLEQSRSHSSRQEGSTRSGSGQSPRKIPVMQDTAPRKGIINEIVSSVFGNNETYCIRCGHFIGYNNSKLFCGNCFQKWARYKKPNYPEKYCNTCGQQKPNISYERPVCRDCYFKNKKT